MSFPQARLGDMHICACPPAPPAPNPVLPPCAVTVLVNGIPAARMGDLALAVPMPPAVPFPHPFVKGSATVMMMGQPALRMGVDPCALGGVVVVASVNVFTGG
jgi:uncharacterized Zn-binding protein involved in type VI secretion